MIKLFTIQRLIYERSNAQMRLFHAWDTWNELEASQASFELKCIDAQLNELQGKKLNTLV